MAHRQQAKRAKLEAQKSVTSEVDKNDDLDPQPALLIQAESPNQEPVPMEP